MLLKCVSDARNVRRDFIVVRESDSGNLSNSRVRLTRSLRGHARAHTSLERRIVGVRSILYRIETRTKRTGLASRAWVLPTFFCELVDGCHKCLKSLEMVRILYYK